MITTITLLTLAVSRAPLSSSQVMSDTTTKAGTFTRIGTPAIWGAVCSNPWTSELALRSAVRYPVVSQAGSTIPTPRKSVEK